MKKVIIFQKQIFINKIITNNFSVYGKKSHVKFITLKKYIKYFFSSDPIETNSVILVKNIQVLNVTVFSKHFDMELFRKHLLFFNLKHT